jgi:hypothetical protein
MFGVASKNNRAAGFIKSYRYIAIDGITVKPCCRSGQSYEALYTSTPGNCDYCEKIHLVLKCIAVHTRRRLFYG